MLGRCEKSWTTCWQFRLAVAGSRFGLIARFEHVFKLRLSLLCEHCRSLQFGNSFFVGSFGSLWRFWSAYLKGRHTVAGGSLNLWSSCSVSTGTLRIGKLIQFALQIIYLVLKIEVLHCCLVELVLHFGLMLLELGLDPNSPCLLDGDLVITALLDGSNCLLCFLYRLSIRCLELLGNPPSLFLELETMKLICFSLEVTKLCIIGCLRCGQPIFHLFAPILCHLCSS